MTPVDHLHGQNSAVGPPRDLAEQPGGEQLALRQSVEVADVDDVGLIAGNDEVVE